MPAATTIARFIHQGARKRMRTHPNDGVIRIATEKTGERVASAVSASLAEAIAAGPIGELTFIASEQGAR